MSFDFISIILIAIALAMDAFSVSITEGLSLKKIKLSQAILIGLFFGGFQALMPVLGWIAGEQVKNLVSVIAPIIAFILLLALGIKMIYDSIKSEKTNKIKEFSHKELTILAIATSIDAFAIGVSFSFLKIPILIPVIIIGIVTFAFSELGVIIGIKVGQKFEGKFEIVGGIILILLGFKILLGF